jgi:hypothetical protein
MEGQRGGDKSAVCYSNPLSNIDPARGEIMQGTLRICICSALLAVPAVHAAQPAAKGGAALPPGGPTDILALDVGQKLTETRTMEAGDQIGTHRGRRVNAPPLPVRASPYDHPYL